jgi:hypothetical protein
MHLYNFIAESNHLFEVPSRIYMQKREWNWRGIEGLAREVQDYCGIFAD